MRIKNLKPSTFALLARIVNLTGFRNWHQRFPLKGCEQLDEIVSWTLEHPGMGPQGPDGAFSILFILLSLLAVSTELAPFMTHPNSTPILRVEDMKAALAFYVDKLGFQNDFDEMFSDFEVLGKRVPGRAFSNQIPTKNFLERAIDCDEIFRGFEVCGDLVGTGAFAIGHYDFSPIIEDWATSERCQRNGPARAIPPR